MKLPARRAGLPGKEFQFSLRPLTPPPRRGLQGAPPVNDRDLILQSTSLSGIVKVKMIYKTRHFARWAQKSGLHDSLLEMAVLEIRRGLLEADLGGGIVKKRIALPGRGKRGSTRTLLATNRNDRWFFVFGFEKNERENISKNELAALKKLAKNLLDLTAVQIAAATREGSLVEVEHEA